jgi:hypothetical protein
MARKLFLDVPREIQLRPEDNMKLRTNQKIILEFNDVKDVKKMLMLPHEGIHDKLNYLIAGLVENGIVFSLAELRYLNRHLNIFCLYFNVKFYLRKHYMSSQNNLSRMTSSGKFLLSDLVKEPSHKITSVRSIRLGNAVFDFEKLRADSKLPRQFLSDPMKYRYLNEYNHRKRNFDKMNEDEIGSTLSRPAKRTLDTSETDFNSYVL